MSSSAHAWRVATLSWVAGTIDTVGYLSLGSVFVTHMTGNTALTAIGLIEHDPYEALRRGFAIPAFFAGGLLGAALVESAEHHEQIARALVIEAALLVGFGAMVLSRGGAPQPLGVPWALALAMLSGAMGIQNAALTHHGARGTHTTHVTGPMTDFALELVRWVSPERRGEFRSERFLRLGVRLAGFGLGAIVGAVLFQLSSAAAPLIAAAVVLVLAAVERHPSLTRPRN